MSISSSFDYEYIKISRTRENITPGLCISFGKMITILWLHVIYLYHVKWIYVFLLLLFGDQSAKERSMVIKLTKEGL